MQRHLSLLLCKCHHHLYGLSLLDITRVGYLALRRWHFQAMEYLESLLGWTGSNFTPGLLDSNKCLLPVLRN